MTLKHDVNFMHGPQSCIAVAYTMTSAIGKRQNGGVSQRSRFAEVCADEASCLRLPGEVDRGPASFLLVSLTMVATLFNVACGSSQALPFEG